VSCSHGCGAGGSDVELTKQTSVQGPNRLTDRPRLAVWTVIATRCPVRTRLELLVQFSHASRTSSSQISARLLQAPAVSLCDSHYAAHSPPGRQRRPCHRRDSVLWLFLCSLRLFTSFFWPAWALKPALCSNDSIGSSSIISLCDGLDVRQVVRLAVRLADCCTTRGFVVDLLCDKLFNLLYDLLFVLQLVVEFCCGPAVRQAV